MYKVGDKFIIEISGVMKSDDDAYQGMAYRIKKSDISLSESQLNQFKNYNEVDVKVIGYNEGLSDAWECVKKICFEERLRANELAAIFDLSDYQKILRNFTPQEAIKMVKILEEKSKEIKIGDIVNDGENNFIVLQILEDGLLRGFSKDNTVFTRCSHEVTKTGKHIDLSEIFKELKDNE